MEECSHGYCNVPSLDLTWEEEEHLQADWHIWSRQDQIMHQVSILSNILDILWVYSSGIQQCEGMGCTQSNSKFHTHKLCNIQHTHTKKPHNPPINSLYTAYLLSNRHKKFKSHCITHCNIHWHTKYQHTKPYNVYDHPNTIRMVENRNLN